MYEGQEGTAKYPDHNLEWAFLNHAGVSVKDWDKCPIKGCGAKRPEKLWKCSWCGIEKGGQYIERGVDGKKYCCWSCAEKDKPKQKKLWEKISDEHGEIVNRYKDYSYWWNRVTNTAIDAFKEIVYRWWEQLQDKPDEEDYDELNRRLEEMR